MPSQGWAGSKETGNNLKCAICIQEDNVLRDAVTQLMGTLVCLQHVAYLPINVYVPKDA